MALRNCQFAAASLASLAMLFPTAVFADGPQPTHADVALYEDGVLVGQMVDSQGTAQGGQEVAILYGNHVIARTTTDQHGMFAARGLRGGQYQLLTANGGAAIRAWAPNTAPPAAGQAALLVVGDGAVRAQGFWGNTENVLSSPLNWMRAHPWLTASAVAVAIAVPLAVIDDDDPSS
jgi:hypothetical protein